MFSREAKQTSLNLGSAPAEGFSVHQEPTSTVLSSSVFTPYRRAGLETTEQEEKDSDSESEEAHSVEGALLKLQLYFGETCMFCHTDVSVSSRLPRTVLGKQQLAGAAT